MEEGGEYTLTTDERWRPSPIANLLNEAAEEIDGYVEDEETILPETDGTVSVSVRAEYVGNRPALEEAQSSLKIQE